MLEYPQIPQYIVWTQTKHITSDCGDVGYKYLYGNGTNYYYFGGLHKYPYDAAYLSGFYQCGDWQYAIGTFYDQFNKHFPGFISKKGINSVDIVQYADLWIELSDHNAILIFVM